MTVPTLFVAKDGIYPALLKAYERLLSSVEGKESDLIACTCESEE